MAIDYHTPNLARWNCAVAEYRASHAALIAAELEPASRVRDEIIAIATDARARLFRTPAPTLAALRAKLENYWGDTSEDTYGNQFRRIILGDLMRISLVAAGVHWDDASGGMDRASLDAHFAEALDEYDHYVELRREGTSTKWDSNTSSDITALMDEAEAKMLSLSAPTLAAVEKKLTALWLDDRYDPIVNSTAHVTILRDIRRLLANDIE